MPRRLLPPPELRDTSVRTRVRTPASHLGERLAQSDVCWTRATCKGRLDSGDRSLLFLSPSMDYTPVRRLEILAGFPRKHKSDSTL